MFIVNRWSVFLQLQKFSTSNVFPYTVVPVAIRVFLTTNLTHEYNVEQNKDNNNDT